MANKNKTGTYIYKFERHFETVMEYRESMNTQTIKTTHVDVTRVTKTIIRKRNKKEA